MIGKVLSSGPANICGIREKVKKQWSAVQFDGGATVNGRWTSAGHFTDTVTPVLKAW